MNRLVLAALLAAVALPAWAANVEVEPQQQDFVTIQRNLDRVQGERKLCLLMMANAQICYLRHAWDEDNAVTMATMFMQICEVSKDEICDETRAYIKQRWGY